MAKNEVINAETNKMRKISLSTGLAQLIRILTKGCVGGSVGHLPLALS